MRRLISSVCGSLACVVVLLAQDQPVIHVNTRLVEVDVVVRGKDGPIPGLTKQDFTLLDRGKPQEIAVFGFQAKATLSGTILPLPSGVVSNRLAEPVAGTGEAPRGATVLLVDRLNTAFENQPYLNKQMLEVLASIKQGAPIALYVLGRDLSVVYDFTADPARLIRAAAVLSKRDPASFASQPGDELLAKRVRTALEETLNLEQVDRRLVTGTALDRIAQHLKDVRGRKSLVWLSGNFPMTNRRPMGGIDVERIGDTAQASNDGNMAIYPVDVKGISANIRFGRRPAPIEGLGNSIILEMARETGGRAFFNSNDISGAIQQAMDDAEVTYTLGFYPAADALDGKYHPIQVKIAKADITNGADVRYREGYVAAEAATVQPGTSHSSLSLDDILDDPLDASAIGLAAAASPMPDKPGVFSIRVSVNVADLHLDRKDQGQWIGSFDLAIQIPDAKPPGAKMHRFEIHATEAQLRDLLAHGFVHQETIESAGSAGSVRVAVKDRTTGAAGSVSVPLH